jgi:hypothetical protein
MRTLLLLPLALLALATIASAQDMESRLEEKLAKDFVKNADWVTDFDAAKAKAKESGKLIFAYFTRSYAP